MFTITPSLQRHTITASYPMHTLCLNHTQNLQPTSLFIVSHRHLTLTLTIGIISSMTNLEHYIHSHRQLNILKITQYQKHLTMLCIAYMVPPYLPSLGTPTPSPHTYSQLLYFSVHSSFKLILSQTALHITHLHI